MKKYLWTVHVVAGLLALFSSILKTDELFRLYVLLSVFSVSALLGLVAIYIKESSNLENEQ